MDEREMTVRSRKLVEKVEDLHEVLLKAGEASLADWAAETFELLFAHDEQGIDLLISGLESLGALDDAVARLNGRLTDGDGQAEQMLQGLVQLRLVLSEDAFALRESFGEK